MKRLFAWVLLVIFPSLAFALSIPLLEGVTRNTNSNIQFKKIDKSSLEISFKIYEVEVNEAEFKTNLSGIPDKDYYEMSFKGIKTTEDVGKAVIPFYSVLIEGRPENLDVSYDSDTSPKELDFLPKPFEELPCRCKKDDEIKSFSLEDYENDERGYFKLEYLGDFRGKPLTRVLMYPGKIGSNANSFLINPDIRYSIKKDQGKLKYFNKPENLIEQYTLSNSNYLIISPDRFLDSLKGFVKWKEKRGFNVRLVSLESIGSTFIEVQSFLHSEYKKEKYEYALLVGHEDIFPTDYVVTDSDSRTPSDLGYFTMGGLDDFIPDVYYGRMVVDTEEDILNQTKKIIEFESGSFRNRSGLKRQIGIASDEGENPSDVEYMKQMQAPLKRTLKIKNYEFFQANNNSTVDKINKILNKGAVWLNYIGHGSGDSWSSINSGEYQSDDVKDLVPGVVKPIIIDVACQNGRFNYEGRLGERFLNESKNGEPIGAVAYYGGSVDISWHPPAKMAVAINKLMVDNKIKVLGKALLAGQMQLYKDHSNLNEVKDNFKWYHLFGDPSLKLSWKK